MKTFTVLLTLILGFAINGWSQNKENSKDKVNYKKFPYWIQMMDDPNVNYFEAVKAFNEFWEGREGPELEEEEEHNEGRKKSIFKRIFVSEEKEKAESFKLVIQYKKFKQWKRDAEPYVQSDGSILSKEEQMKIWENARK